tara:strand:+ start:158 stop:799 length:642 start_codon:yes stop_codon:yes gene_type:complete
MSYFSSLLNKKTKTYFKKFRKFNAVNGLDKKMLEYLNFENGFYIECGANDGVDQSNTWYYEKKLNWRGILIEPLEDNFLELKKNRGNKNLFIQAALVSSNDIHTIHVTSQDLQSQISIAATTDLLSKESKTVTALTLTKILEESNAPNIIDFFSLDIEGYEEEAIKGINFAKFNFNYFLIENSNDNIAKILLNNNYQFLKKLSDHDFLFHHKN